VGEALSAGASAATLGAPFLFPTSRAIAIQAIEIPADGTGSNCFAQAARCALFAD